MTRLNLPYREIGSMLDQDINMLRDEIKAKFDDSESRQLKIIEGVDDLLNRRGRAERAPLHASMEAVEEGEPVPADVARSLVEDSLSYGRKTTIGHVILKGPGMPPRSPDVLRGAEFAADFAKLLVWKLAKYTIRSQDLHEAR